MELNIGNFNSRELYKKTEDILYKEFNKLCEEFPEIKDANYPFAILTKGDYVELLWDIMKDHPSYKTPDNVVKEIISDLRRTTIMTTTLFYVRHTDGYAVQMVHMFSENLVNELYWCIGEDKYDKLIDIFKISLRHEVGHLLANMSISKKHSGDYPGIIRELDELDQQTTNELQQLSDDYKDKPHDAIHYKRYYSTPCEKLANEMVGLTWEDLYNANRGVYCV